VGCVERVRARIEDESDLVADAADRAACAISDTLAIVILREREVDLVAGAIELSSLRQSVGCGRN
jgi:hypothetical protein